MTDMDEKELKEWVKQRSKTDDRLYERYGKPFEPAHKGEFLALSDDGGVLLGTDSTQVVHLAIEKFGSGRFSLRRIGHKVAFTWRKTFPLSPRNSSLSGASAKPPGSP